MRSCPGGAGASGAQRRAWGVGPRLQQMLKSHWPQLLCVPVIITLTRCIKCMRRGSIMGLVVWDWKQSRNWNRLLLESTTLLGWRAAVGWSWQEQQTNWPPSSVSVLSSARYGQNLTGSQVAKKEMWSQKHSLSLTSPSIERWVWSWKVTNDQHLMYIIHQDSLPAVETPEIHTWNSEWVVLACGPEILIFEKETWTIWFRGSSNYTIRNAALVFLS